MIVNRGNLKLDTIFRRIATIEVMQHIYTIDKKMLCELLDNFREVDYSVIPL